MLPKQFTDLAENFMKAFDLERPPAIEYRLIHNKAAAWAAQSGMGFQGGAALGHIAKGITDYMQEKAALLRDKLQQVANSTEIEFYPELNTDLKAYCADYMSPRLRGAEQQFEMIRTGTTAPTGFTDQFRMNLNAILPKTNADLDLFCAEYETKERNRKRMNTPNIVYNLTGNNARVNIGSTDYSVNIADSKMVFSEVRKAIEGGIEDTGEREKLLVKTAELEKNVGNKTNYARVYAEFIACAANHMKLIGPWIPAITKWLTGP